MEPEASEPDQQGESEHFKIGQPSVELGQVLIGQCADFRTATHLLCLTRAWAAIAADDTTWKPLATLIAREAKLYLPATKSSDGSWRAECGRLFGARGTFVTTFASQPTPEPERTLRRKWRWLGMLGVLAPRLADRMLVRRLGGEWRVPRR